MRESVWAVFIVSIGIVSIAFVYFFQSMTNTDEHNYHLLKETTEAAMYDAFDLAAYRIDLTIRIDGEKFVENFIRRFSDSVNSAKSYQIEFYEIYEKPPKATVRIKTGTKEYQVTSDSSVDFDIVTILSGILESKNTE